MQQDLIDETDWQTVEGLLPGNYEYLAEQHGFITADDRGDEKDVSVPVKLRMMLCQAANSLSLRTTAALFAAAGVVSVSHVALHHWFKRAGPFLSALMAALVEANRVFAPEYWAGYRVRAVDASTVEKPGAKGVTARIHYVLELDSMLVPEALVTDEKTGETFRNFNIEPGTLNVGDRGYCNARGIAEVVRRRADALVRWNYGAAPLQFRDGRIVNASQIARSLKVEGLAQEWAVALTRTKQRLPPIPCRLVAMKLPPKKAAEARARLRKTAESPPTKEAVFLAGFIMLVTTVPAERMSAPVLIELYRLRWQIELQFKREKSIGELDRLPNFLPATIHSWLLAKLISAELSRRLFLRPGSVGPQLPTNSGSHEERRTTDIEAHRPVHAQAPWEMKVLAHQVIRRCLLALPQGRAALQRFADRFVQHLKGLKATGSKRRRQLSDFLALLEVEQASSA